MIKLSNEISKRLSKEEYYNEADFIADCKVYIKALKAGRLLFKVEHVSNSGMSRKISITSFEGKCSKGYYRQYGKMLEALGYKVNYDYSNTNVTQIGCGMDMVWNLNYSIVKSIFRIGIINKKTCDVLSQKING